MKRYTINSNIISKTNDKDEVILINLENNDFYFKLNDMTAEVWTKLVKEVDTEKICEYLCQKHQANRDEIKENVNQLLNDLIENKIISSYP